MVEEDRRLARLEDVLAEFPEVQVNIDIKQKSRHLVEEVNRIVVEQQAEGIFLVDCLIQNSSTVLVT